MYASPYELNCTSRDTRDQREAEIRDTQPVIGMGLLEAVPEATLQALGAEQKKQGLGGRINYVWDFFIQCRAAGRFGRKAGLAILTGQTAPAQSSRTRRAGKD